MAFTIPNEADAGFADQAEPDKVDLDIIVAGIQGNGVVTGCAVSAQGTPDMTVAVATGYICINNTLVNVASGNVNIGAADATNPRFDLITVNNSGTKACTAGTAAAQPAFPIIPANSVVLASVYVPATDTTIAANQITDKRCIVKGEGVGVRVHNSAVQSISNNTLTALTFDSERYDNGAFHSTASNTERLTAPVAGYYHFGANVGIASNATSQRQVRLRINGTTYVASKLDQGTAAGDAIMNVHCDYHLDANDYVEVVVYQLSGGSLNSTVGANMHPEFWLHLLRAD